MQEENKMNRKQSIIILLVVLVALTAVASVLLATYQASLRTPPNFPFAPRPYFPNPADIELYYMARTVFSTINIVLTVILIVNYVSIYQKTKSEFTVGLLLFAALFLIKDIMWSPFVIGLGGFTLIGLGPFAVLPDLFEMAALLVLFYMSVKY
jgi:small-conductance mechanosensitive channel